MDTPTSPASVTDRIMALIAGIMAQGGRAQGFRAEDALVDVGLTSLDLVNLMLAVETEFDLMIPPTQLTVTNFASAAQISRMVVSILAEARTPAYT